MILLCFFPIRSNRKSTKPSSSIYFKSLLNVFFFVCFSSQVTITQRHRATHREADTFSAKAEKAEVFIKFKVFPYTENRKAALWTCKEKADSPLFTYSYPGVVADKRKKKTRDMRDCLSLWILLLIYLDQEYVKMQKESHETQRWMQDCMKFSLKQLGGSLEWNLSR